jgi:membrane fusion protein (multidrug efflux system)
MAVDIEVPTELAKDYVVVPSTAIRRASFGDHVFVITPGDPGPDGHPSMVAHQRMVTLGPDLGGTVIVATGLQAGEKIAAAGSFKLHEGATVFPGAPPVASPAGAAPAPAPTGSAPTKDEPKTETAAK